MVLPGVTRDSIMALCAAHLDPTNDFKVEGLPEKFKVTERSMTMGEIVAAEKDGSLREMFGSGTAAIVSPVNRIGYVLFLSRTNISLGFPFYSFCSQIRVTNSPSVGVYLDIKERILPFLAARTD